jgi:FlaA1/EpsC-like NDP-sugar epimerase
MVILLTTPVVAFLAERSGFSARPAVESGLLLSQTSELSLVVVLEGMILMQITPDVFTTVAVITALTMLLTPLIVSARVTRWVLRFHPLRRDTVIERQPADHVVLLGCGEAGMPLLETLLSSGHDVVVVDDDPGVIARLREGGVPSIRGDALDPEVLQDAAVSRASIVSSTVRRPRDNRLILGLAREIPVLVRVFDDEDAEWVSLHGGTPILSSEAAANAFFVWFDGVKTQAQAGSQAQV